MSDHGSNDSQSSQPHVRHQPTTESEIHIPSIESDWSSITAEEQLAIRESNRRAMERLPELERWLTNVERDVATQQANRERGLGMSIEEFLREKDNNATVREGRSAMHHGPAQDDVEMDDIAASAHTLVSSKKNAHARPSSSLSPESATSTAGRPGKKRSKQHASFSPHGEADLDTDGASVPGIFEEDLAMHEAAPALPEAPPVFPGPEAAPQSIDDFRV